MSNWTVDDCIRPIQKRRRDVDHESKNNIHDREEERQTEPFVGDDIIDAIGEGDAINKRTLKRLTHNAVDVTIAAVSGEQIHFIAKHGFYFFSILLCKLNNLCAVRHDLHTSQNISIAFQQLNRQPALW